MRGRTVNAQYPNADIRAVDLDNELGAWSDKPGVGPTVVVGTGGRPVETPYPKEVRLASALCRPHGPLPGCDRTALRRGATVALSTDGDQVYEIRARVGEKVVFSEQYVGH
jgi:hypothetical protein